MTMAAMAEHGSGADIRRAESLRRELIDDTFVGRGTDGIAERAERDAGLHARFDDRDAPVCTKDGLLVCLAPHHLVTNSDELVDLLTDALSPHEPWWVRVGRTRSGPGAAARAFAQACAALDIGERLHLPEGVLHARDLLVIGWRDRKGLA